LATVELSVPAAQVALAVAMLVVGPEGMQQRA
jgi:hypothetical protein